MKIEEMNNDKTIRVLGPVLREQGTAATITLKHHPVTASVIWSVGSIDLNGPASDAFDQRLEAAGMPGALRDWWMEHSVSFSHLAKLEPSCRWGRANYITPTAAADLLELVARFYRAAALDLPTQDDRPSRAVHGL